MAAMKRPRRQSQRPTPWEDAHLRRGVPEPAGQECAICLDDFSDPEAMFSLGCAHGHAFCFPCLGTDIRIKVDEGGRPRCPCCPVARPYLLSPDEVSTIIGAKKGGLEASADLAQFAGVMQKMEKVLLRQGLAVGAGAPRRPLLVGPLRAEVGQDHAVARARADVGDRQRHVAALLRRRGAQAREAGWRGAGDAPLRQREPRAEGEERQRPARQAAAVVLPFKTPKKIRKKKRSLE